MSTDLGVVSSYRTCRRSRLYCYLGRNKSTVIILLLALSSTYRPSDCMYAACFLYPSWGFSLALHFDNARVSKGRLKYDKALLGF